MRRTTIPVHGVLAAAIAVAAVLPTSGLAQAVPSPLACGERYVIAAGDSLSSVAQRVYGDPKRYDVLYSANRETIGGDPGSVAVGQSLIVPCLDASGLPVTAEAAAQAETALQTVVSLEGPLDATDLDTLFGPVALFPDSLLTQVLMAATVPLDVVKADRFIDSSTALSDADRAAAIAAESWDASVQDLAAGFPDLVGRMADHIDWTEQAGEAVLAQTEDVLDAIQRLRTKAQANGYLADNEAQTVEVVNDQIYIAPADAEVIYVPTYDSQVVYTAPYAGSAYDPYYYGYDNDDWGDALAAGAIIFGSAIILDEIFDNGDNWGHGGSIDWDRGDINIDRGDINIDRSDISIGDGTIGGGNRGGLADRPSRPASAPGRIGGPEDGALSGRRDGTFAPDAASRDVARQKIETRKAVGTGAATLPASRPATKAGTTARSRPSTSARPTTSRPTAARPTTTRPSASVSRPTTTRRPSASSSYRSGSSSAFQYSGGARASAGASRGRASSGGGGRRR